MIMYNELIKYDKISLEQAFFQLQIISIIVDELYQLTMVLTNDLLLRYFLKVSFHFQDRNEIPIFIKQDHPFVVLYLLNKYSKRATDCFTTG